MEDPSQFGKPTPSRHSEQGRRAKRGSASSSQDESDSSSSGSAAEKDTEGQEEPKGGKTRGAGRKTKRKDKKNKKEKKSKGKPRAGGRAGLPRQLSWARLAVEKSKTLLQSWRAGTLKKSSELPRQHQVLQQKLDSLRPLALAGADRAVRSEVQQAMDRLALANTLQLLHTSLAVNGKDGKARKILREAEQLPGFTALLEDLRPHKDVLVSLWTVQTHASLDAGSLEDAGLCEVQTAAFRQPGRVGQGAGGSGRGGRWAGRGRVQEQGPGGGGGFREEERRRQGLCIQAWRAARTRLQDLYQTLHLPRLAAALGASAEAAAEVQCSLLCQLQDNQLWKLSGAMPRADGPSGASPAGSGAAHAGVPELPPGADKDFDKLLRLLLPLGDADTWAAYQANEDPEVPVEAAAAEEAAAGSLGDLGMFDSDGEGTADAAPAPPQPPDQILEFPKSVQADARHILTVLMHCDMMRP
jgi:hypothetical protein